MISTNSGLSASKRRCRMRIDSTISSAKRRSIWATRLLNSADCHLGHHLTIAAVGQDKRNYFHHRLKETANKAMMEGSHRQPRNLFIESTMNSLWRRVIPIEWETWELRRVTHTQGAQQSMLIDSQAQTICWQQALWMKGASVTP